MLSMENTCREPGSTAELLTPVAITISFSTIIKGLHYIHEGRRLDQLTWGNLYSPRSLAMETDRDDRVSPTRAA